MTIRKQLFAAAGIAIVACIGLGVYAAASVMRLNELVRQTYDNALMASTFAQSAQTDFVRLDRALRDALATRDLAEFERQEKLAETSSTTLLEDLGVVRDRTLSDKGRVLVAEITSHIEAWEPKRKASLVRARERLSAGTPTAALTDGQAVESAPRDVEAKLTALTDDATEMGFNFREASAHLGARTLKITYAMVAAAVVMTLLAFLLLARRIVAPLLALAEQLTALAGGDLTRRIATRRRDEMGQVARSYNAVADELGGMVREIMRAADGLSLLSRELTEAIVRLSGGAQAQASALDETAASIQVVAAAIKQNAGHARHASEVADRSRDVAERGGQVVVSAVGSMQEIDRASRKIADIIATVDEIAFQTNLLALNAAVEAARAGEQGRGFAVVAGEVRNLAQRSAVASREIKTLIGDSVSKVGTGSELVNRSGDTLRQIVAAVHEVSGSIGEIAGASQEQATQIDQISHSVGEMNERTQQNAAESEELSAMADTLSGRARELQALVGGFLIEGDSDRDGEASPDTLWLEEDQYPRAADLSARPLATVA